MEKMISHADLEGIRAERIQCRSCGTSWLRRDKGEKQYCHYCGSPYMEEEEKNVIRKS